MSGSYTMEGGRERREEEINEMFKRRTTEDLNGEQSEGLDVRLVVGRDGGLDVQLRGEARDGLDVRPDDEVNDRLDGKDGLDIKMVPNHVRDEITVEGKNNLSQVLLSNNS